MLYSVFCWLVSNFRIWMPVSMCNKVILDCNVSIHTLTCMKLVVFRGHHCGFVRLTQFFVRLCCVALDCIVLCCTPLQSAVLHFFALHCISWYWVALHCVVLCCVVWHWWWFHHIFVTACWWLIVVYIFSKFCSFLMNAHQLCGGRNGRNSGSFSLIIQVLD